MKVNLQTIAKVIVTFAAFIILFLVLRGVNVSLALRILISANPFALVAVIFLEAVSITLRLVRWKYMLLPTRKVPVMTLVTPLLVSFAVGNLTVTGVGAVPRIYLLNRHTGINPGFIAGTIAQEYVVDATALVFWAATVPFLVRLPREFHFAQLLLILPLTLLLLANFALWRRESVLIDLLVRLGLWFRILSILPNFVRQNLDSFGDGLSAAFAYPVTLTVVGLATALIWAVEALTFWLLLLSLGIPFTYLQASAIMAFVEVIIGLPSLPGFVGTLEAATASLVVALGGARESALAYALLLHVFVVVPTTLAGALLAWRAGLRILR
ncbi:MAG: flippase-like domain-containing protein [Chloroflexi bacterium]|nr:flippase-like domain-containing protein [Chloroflexota bacterium]